MNKKYIDFVPVKPEGSSKKSTTKSTGRADSRDVELSELEVSEMFDVRTTKPKAGVTVSAKKNNKAASVPKARFVNTEKVIKRPLSKNAYTKKEIPVPKEEKLPAPVKIIDKPAKDSKAGLIVTIILTIILGAAAGTVAFLLLPK